MTNYQLVKYQADNIPPFDGNPKQINRFLRACENFLATHQDRNNVQAPLNSCLFDTVLSKLVGRAADLIASRIELNTWDAVKNALIMTFADQRSVDCVVQDLISTKPFKGETPQNFGIRLQDARSLLISKINMNDDPIEIKRLRIEQYEDLALKTFINGLNYHMQLVVRLRNPQNLEEAMSLSQEEENFIQYRNRSIPHNNNEKSQAPQTFQPAKFYKPPQQNFYTNQNYRPQHYPMNRPQNYPMNRPQFNNQPFNFTQRNNPSGHHQFFRSPNFQQNNNFSSRQFPNYTQRPFNYNQTFGQRFGNGSQNSRLPKPEPMDTSSGNTIINKSPLHRTHRNESMLFNQSVEPPCQNCQCSNQYMLKSQENSDNLEYPMLYDEHQEEELISYPSQNDFPTNPTDDSNFHEDPPTTSPR